MKGAIVNRVPKKDRDKKPPRWAVVITLPFDPQTGKYPQVWKAVDGGKREAEALLRDLLHKYETGDLAKPGKTTVAEYLERWMNDYARVHLGPRTVEGYGTIIKCHLVPELGRYSLRQLKPARIAQFYGDMLSRGRRDGNGGLSSTTVRQHAMVLHKALETAVEWGLLSRNPADNMKIPRPAYHEWTPFDEAGARRILEASRDHALYPVFHLAVGSGMRRSEIMALRWCDVDLERRAVYVTRTLHQLHSGEYVIRPPKTAAGRRTVKLTPDVVDVLRGHRAHREAESAICGVDLDEQGLVFAKGDGSHIRPDYVSSVWRNVARRCNLRGVRLHDARHLHATVLLKRGAHPKIVQSRLGHGSVKVTMDIYSHVLDDMQDVAIEGFDAQVFKPAPERIP